MLLPLLMQLNMLGRDRHDGGHELGNPYKKQEKQNTVRSSLEQIINAENAGEPMVVEVITARAVPGATGVLGGDLINLEIAELLEMAAIQDEDESISLLLLH